MKVCLADAPVPTPSFDPRAHILARFWVEALPQMTTPTPGPDVFKYARELVLASRKLRELAYKLATIDGPNYCVRLLINRADRYEFHVREIAQDILYESRRCNGSRPHPFSRRTRG